MKWPKKVYLIQVKGRLENEVGSYLFFLNQRITDTIKAQKPPIPGIGFFGGIRLLMPVIDGLSEVLLKNSKKDTREKSIRLLERLKIPFPSLVWFLYRNSLIHTDKPSSLVYKKNGVGWRISIGLLNEVNQKGILPIDIKKLYEALMIFIDNEIDNAKGNVYVEEYIRITKFNSKKLSLKEEIIAINNYA